MHQPAITARLRVLWGLPEPIVSPPGWPSESSVRFLLASSTHGDRPGGAGVTEYAISTAHVIYSPAGSFINVSY